MDMLSLILKNPIAKLDSLSNNVLTIATNANVSISQLRLGQKLLKTTPYSLLIELLQRGSLTFTHSSQFQVSRYLISVNIRAPSIGIGSKKKAGSGASLHFWFVVVFVLARNHCGNIQGMTCFSSRNPEILYLVVKFANQTPNFLP